MSFYPKSTGNYSAKTKKRAKYGIVAGAVIVLLVMSFMLSRPLVVGSPKESHKISLQMEAQVYREGELIAERINDDDLLVENFLNLTKALFHWPNDADYEIGFWPNGEMEEVDFKFWGSTILKTVYDTTSGAEVNGYRALLDVGEGTDPVARSDYWMQDSMATEIIYSVYDQDADGFTITFIWVSDGSYDWSETGLNKWMYTESWDSELRVFFAFDTFTPIAIVLGDSCVVNYRFVFGTGYTTNAINLMRGFMIGATHDQSSTISMTDNTGTSRTINMYDSDTSETEFVGHYDSAYHGGWIIVSDSSSGIPSRSAYRLLGSNVLINSVSAVDGDPNYDVTITATLIPSSSITIRCAGFYLYTAYVGGDGYFLMFALSHSGVYVAENTPVQATFTLEI